ncbi:MAG: bifunctional adenosylcobinamide kinase/adenosylcobinamide-phosphate guanylyltransferase [Cyanobacteriota bacterium]|nr:bifunctional adenosylcobinamide kinase/adenosylcobinamide-phosphate guanylyltransferase [Cyanobacteriota bacterium]
MVEPFPPALPRLSLVSGPARSGKSQWAEHLAHASGRPVVYVATGPRLPDDAAWQRRLDRHRRRRPSHWACLEVEGDLAAALEALDPDGLALVDSLGTWVAAHLELEDDAWRQEERSLIAAIGRCPVPLVLVCEETGWGVVPATRAGGRFRDRLGRLQARVTAIADRSWLVLQGRVVDLLAISQPLPPRV